MNLLKSNDPILVIIGPSGSGKSSVVQELARRGVIEVTPSWTTRPTRNGEATHSIEHNFVSEEEFDKQKQRGFFLAVVELFGLPYHYGLPKVQQPKNNRVPLIMLRASLLPLLPKHYSKATIYQVQDEFDKVKDRLQERQTDGEQQGSRLDDYQKEMELGRKSANRVFTNRSDIELLADDIEKAISEDFRKP